jgi:hypothetical protein
MKTFTLPEQYQRPIEPILPRTSISESSTESNELSPLGFCSHTPSSLSTILASTPPCLPLSPNIPFFLNDPSKDCNMLLNILLSNPSHECMKLLRKMCISIITREKLTIEKQKLIGPVTIEELQSYIHLFNNTPNMLYKYSSFILLFTSIVRTLQYTSTGIVTWEQLQSLENIAERLYAGNMEQMEHVKNNNKNVTSGLLGQIVNQK